MEQFKISIMLPLVTDEEIDYLYENTAVASFKGIPFMVTLVRLEHQRETIDDQQGV